MNLLSLDLERGRVNCYATSTCRPSLRQSIQLPNYTRDFEWDTLRLEAFRVDPFRFVKAWIGQVDDPIDYNLPTVLEPPCA